MFPSFRVLKRLEMKTILVSQLLIAIRYQPDHSSSTHFSFVALPSPSQQAGIAFWYRILYISYININTHDDSILY